VIPARCSGTQKIFPSEVIDLLSGCLFGEPRILASTRQRQHTETHLDHLFIVQPFCYFFNMSHWCQSLSLSVFVSHTLNPFYLKMAEDRPIACNAGLVPLLRLLQGPIRLRSSDARVIACTTDENC